MSRLALLVLFAGCIPLTTSTTSSVSPPRGSQVEAPRGSPVEEPRSSPEPTAPSGTGEDQWFLSDSSAMNGPVNAVPASSPDGTTWFIHTGAPAPRNLAHGMRTVPATADRMRNGRPVIVQCAKPGVDPNTTWWLVVPERYDPATGTYDMMSDRDQVCPHPLSIANTRWIVEYKNPY